MTLELSDLPIADRLSIETVCDAFESALSDSKFPRIEDWIEQSSHADILFAELLKLEIEWGKQSDQEILLEDYLDRFPNRRSKVEEVFDQFQSTVCYRTPNPATRQTLNTRAATHRNESPVANTRAEFEASWRNSNIHSDDEITAYLETLPDTLAEAPAVDVARYAAKQKWLTRYQAKSILTGKTKALNRATSRILTRSK